MGEAGEYFVSQGAVCDEQVAGVDGAAELAYHVDHVGGGEGGVFLDSMQGGAVLQQQLKNVAVLSQLTRPLPVAAGVDALVKDTAAQHLIEGCAVLRIGKIDICTTI